MYIYIYILYVYIIGFRTGMTHTMRVILKTTITNPIPLWLLCFSGLDNDIHRIIFQVHEHNDL